VLEELRTLDQVAYVRFASVYRRFDSVGEFLDIVETMAEEDLARGAAASLDQSPSRDSASVADPEVEPGSDDTLPPSAEDRESARRGDAR
jgi:transcriptional repressor NrdR